MQNVLACIWDEACTIPIPDGQHSALALGRAQAEPEFKLQVSRRQCELSTEGGVVLLKSCGKYGTWVVKAGGAQLVPAGEHIQLLVGDCLGLHSTKGQPHLDYRLQMLSPTDVQIAADDKHAVKLAVPRQKSMLLSGGQNNELPTGNTTVQHLTGLPACAEDPTAVPFRQPLAESDVEVVDITEPMVKAKRARLESDKIVIEDTAEDHKTALGHDSVQSSAPQNISGSVVVTKEASEPSAVPGHQTTAEQPQAKRAREPLSASMDGWSCASCTFVNAPAMVVCEMCAQQRVRKDCRKECKMGCGVPVAANSSTGRSYNTCCRGCAAFGQSYHSEGCNGNTVPVRMPWRLLKTHALKGGAGNEGAVTLRQLVSCKQAPLFVVIQNFMIDPVWLMSSWPELAAVPRIVIFHGKQDDLPHHMMPAHAELHYRCPAALRFKHPTTGISSPIQYGVMHSKMFMIGFPAGIRLIVTTANLLYTDWHNKCNGVWSQDFRKKASVSTGPSEFEDSLCQYMETLTVHSERICNFPGAASADTCLVDMLREYDYRGSTGHLVPTTPGYHPAATMHRWGHLRIGRLLQREGPVFPSEAAVHRGLLLFQYSSFSASDDKFLRELSNSFVAGKCEDDSALGRSELQLIWPTAEEVRHCVEGYASGASMPSTAANVAKVIPEKARAWSSQQTGISAAVASRRIVMPHIKTLTRLSRDASTIAWTCLTSCNLSKAAWGTLQKNSSQLFCRHWELGLLFTPASVGRKQDGFSCDMPAVPNDATVSEPSDRTENLCHLVPPQGPADAQGALDAQPSTLGRRKALIPLPFQVPPAAYPNAKPWMMSGQMWTAEPWHCDVDRPSRPDKHGWTNCGGAQLYDNVCAE